MSHGSTDSDSSPSMHRFWTVPELMSMVCEELQGPDDGSDENGDGEGDRTEFKSLTILARTCKFLSEPALDIIWSQLDNTTPLWFCLGHDIWESREGDLLYLTRPIERAQWTRFHVHAARVRSLGVRDSIDVTGIKVISDETYQLLGSSDPFLPNLRALHWSKGLGPLQVYLCPTPATLSRLTIHPGGTVPMDLSVVPSLNSIDEKCSISHLTIVGVDSLIPNHAACLSDLVTHLRKLVRFTSSWPLPVHIYGHLATLTSLRGLFIAIEHQEQTFCDFLRSRHSAFGHLEDLILLAQSFSNVMPVINMLSMPQLQTLEVAAFHDNGCNMQQLFKAIASTCSASALENIVIMQKHASPAYEFLPSTLRPLLPFRSLKRLSIDTGHGYQLNDEILEEMARSWPLIEELLLSRGGWRGRSQCTWAGLIAIIHHCRNLVEVAIALCTPDCSLDMVPTAFMRHHTIEKIDFLDSPISDSQSVALLLSALSFSLFEVDGWDDDLIRPGQNPMGAVWRTRWLEVQNHINWFVEAREDEQRRGLASKGTSS